MKITQILILSLFVFLTACTKEREKSSKNDIVDFYFPNRQYEVKIETNEIVVFMQDTQPVDQMVPVIKVSQHAWVSPASHVARDFTKNVSYTVTAENGDIKEYTVKVRRNSDNELISFSIPNKTHDVHIEGSEVIVDIYRYIDITKLTPIVVVSEGATVNPPSGSSVDFTEPVTYTVTALDGSTAEYVVKIRRSDNKDLISFSIPNQICDVHIEGSEITVDVYRFVDITKLTPIVVVSQGATVNPPSGSIVDFTEPVIYTVTASDGSVATYTITVNKNLSRRNDIEKFELGRWISQIFEREGDNLFIHVSYETDITNIQTNIVVSDMATVSPASGTFVDFTNPQIYTVTASDGASKNYLVTVKRSPWRKMGNIPYRAKDGAGVVVFKDKIWLLGGWLHGPYYDDVWVPGGEWQWGPNSNDVWSSDDGINWQFVNYAPWSPRAGHGCVVFDDAIWVIGGNARFTDVWKSYDGINWEEATNDAPWGCRANPYVAVFKNKLWLMGGIDTNIRIFNDVWSSTDGKNWTLENSYATWSPRAYIHGYAVLNDELYIMGGGIKTAGIVGANESGDIATEYNDVWKTNDGRNWIRVIQYPPWRPRYHLSVITYNGYIFVNDGSIGLNVNLSNETWYSSNGYDWKQVKYNFWPPTHASSLMVFKNKLWLIAGYGLRDIWSLDFNDL